MVIPHTKEVNVSYRMYFELMESFWLVYGLNFGLTIMVIPHTKEVNVSCKMYFELMESFLLVYDLNSVINLRLDDYGRSSY